MSSRLLEMAVVHEPDPEFGDSAIIKINGEEVFRHNFPTHTGFGPEAQMDYTVGQFTGALRQVLSKAWNES